MSVNREAAALRGGCGFDLVQNSFILVPKREGKLVGTQGCSSGHSGDQGSVQRGGFGRGGAQLAAYRAVSSAGAQTAGPAAHPSSVTDSGVPVQGLCNKSFLWGGLICHRRLLPSPTPNTEPWENLLPRVPIGPGVHS